MSTNKVVLQTSNPTMIRKWIFFQLRRNQAYTDFLTCLWILFVSLGNIQDSLQSIFFIIIHQIQMTNPYFSIDTLMNGGQQMLQLIKQCAEDVYGENQKLVLPQVEPGFLRNQMAQNPPQQGKAIEHLFEMTKKVIFPGTFRWQSPKFFGYYGASVNVTNIFGDMFHVVNHSPNFSFGTSPAWTELENIMVDWSAKALGLPEDFLLKNSGGGIIQHSATEAIFNAVQVAKYAKRKELGIELNNPDILKLVGYFGQGCHISSERALTIKDIHYRRSVPYLYNKEILNYELDVDRFEEMVEEDVKNGLIPFWTGFSYGNTLCAAIDVSERALKICKKYKMYVNLDAAWLGSTWISQKFRPPKEILENVDTMDINFSKLLLNATGGSLFYVRDKKMLTQAFGASLEFHFYKNKFTGQHDVVDYKDWSLSLSRRNNAIKLYYTFEHYGFKMLRQTVQNHQEKLEYLVDLVTSYPKHFQLLTVAYGIINFAVLDSKGQISNELTKQVSEKISNCSQGFTSPGFFKGQRIIRIVIGNFHTTRNHILKYVENIVQEVQRLNT